MMRHVPNWPPLAGVAALLVAGVVAAFAPLLAAVGALATGGSRAEPGIVLIGAALSAAGIVAIVVALARLTRPVTPEQLGLRPLRDLTRALLLTAGAALLLAAVAGAWALGPGFELTVPPEVDTRTLTAQAYDLPLREPPEWSPRLVASALARCVLPVVAGEILLRGFVFPALSGWRGPLTAAAIVAIVFGGAGQLLGTPGIAVSSMLLGLLLCLLYVATGSLRPGIALATAAAAATFGAACALPPAEIAALTAACVPAAVGLAAAPLLRPGAARRPQLHGSAA
jgi:membrane protease YdiL (CAAX protease family)